VLHFRHFYTSTAMCSGLGCNPSGKKLSIPFALHIACYPQADRVCIVCKNLCSASGQNLFTSIYISESVYAIIVGMLGLLLVASLIVNMRVSALKPLLCYWLSLD